MKILFVFFILYFVLKFVMKVVLPTSKTVYDIKKKVNDMNASQNSSHKANQKSEYDKIGEYIDFEEVK